MLKNKIQEKISIVRPVVSDAESMIKHLNKVGGETDNLTYGKNESPLTIEQEKEFLEKMEKQEVKPPFFIAKNEAGEVIGVATCFAKKKKRLAHVSELGISIQKKYWRQGIGNALMDKVIGSCKEMGVEKIELRVNADNEGAIALYKKKGFEIEGLLKKEKKVKKENGYVYFDTYMMARFL